MQADLRALDDILQSAAGHVSEENNADLCSRAHQEEQEGQQHQVQGPLLEERLHPCSQGHRQGREAQAVSSPGYVNMPLQFIRLAF